MINSFQDWTKRYPEAAAALLQIQRGTDTFVSKASESAEGAAQQRARVNAAKQGGILWRNNVGATKAVEHHTCPKCRFSFRVEKTPVRYGLCNDSQQLNKHFKSSDLIGIYPLTITHSMVGSIVGQFWAVEVKAPGTYINMNDQRIAAQANYGALVEQRCGKFQFSYGDINT